MKERSKLYRKTKETVMSTEKKMQKGKLIQQYIGEGIAPFKFTYQGRRGDSWIFEKNFNGVIQTISIYEYRFGENMISFDLYTDVPGRGIVQAVGIQGIEFNSELPGFWKYEDKESFIEILEVIKDILIQKGMRNFNLLSKERKELDTPEMHQELYVHHDELAEKFQKKYNLSAETMDQEHMEQWFSVIEKRADVMYREGYEKTKDEYLEIAAFLGVQLERFMGGEWRKCQVGKEMRCRIERGNGVEFSLDILGRMGWIYQRKNGIQIIKQDIEEMWENRYEPEEERRKEELLQHYVGEALEEYGFKRKKKDLIWIKRKRGVISTIWIQFWGKNEITFTLFSNKGECPVQADDFQNVEFNGNIRGRWKYSNDEELVNVLLEIKDILLKRGLPVLEKMGEGYLFYDLPLK